MDLTHGNITPGEMHLLQLAAIERSDLYTLAVLCTYQNERMFPRFRKVPRYPDMMRHAYFYANLEVILQIFYLNSDTAHRYMPTKLELEHYILENPHRDSRAFIRECIHRFCQATTALGTKFLRIRHRLVIDPLDTEMEETIAKNFYNYVDILAPTNECKSFLKRVTH